MTTAQTITAVVLWLAVFTLLILVLLLYRQVERAYHGTGFGRSGGLIPGVEIPPIQVMTSAGPTFLDLPADGERYLLAFVSPDCDGCKLLLDTLARHEVFDGSSIGILIDPVPQGQPVPELPTGVPLQGAASPQEVRRHFGITVVPLLYVMRDRAVLANGPVTTNDEVGKLLQEADMNEAEMQDMATQAQGEGLEPALAVSSRSPDG